MARVLVWSHEAVEDIDAIAAYIERDSPWYARAVASKIVETVESIPEYPELGRMVPEIDDPYVSGWSTVIASSTVWMKHASSSLR